MAKTQATKLPSQFGCFGFVGGALFAVPFAAVGLVMAIGLVWTMIEARAMQTWVETPAIVTRADLQTHSDEGTTYKAIAEYDYDFSGQKYHGNRVSLTTGSDNIGDFQILAHQELKSHQTSGRPFRCFVNPQRPSESILYRELRWEMAVFYDVFVLMFGGIGGGMLLGFSLAAYRNRRRIALSIENPDSPWLWRADWAANEIETSNRDGLMAIVVAAIFWNVAVLPLWWVVPPQLLRGNLWALLAASLPVIGIVLGACAVRSYLRRAKYGRCVFRFKKPGPVIGGVFEGAIETTRPLESEGFDVVLACHRKFANDDGDAKKDELWSRKEHARADKISDWTSTVRTEIKVRFEISEDCKPTSETSGDKILWSLTATSDDPAHQFKADFAVPVF